MSFGISSIPLSLNFYTYLIEKCQFLPYNKNILLDRGTYMMIDIETMIKSYKRICWYPSAGADFRELLFLSEQYCKRKDVPVSSTEQPKRAFKNANKVMSLLC